MSIPRGLVRYKPDEAQRAHARMKRAYVAGVAARCPAWWPELGPCNAVERAIVRRVVAARVTYDCSRPAVFSGDARIEQLRAATRAHREAARG